jgi:hypothetical protein
MSILVLFYIGTHIINTYYEHIFIKHYERILWNIYYTYIKETHIIHIMKHILYIRRGFASHPASCAYLHGRRMMGSTCSLGSHLGIPPLASNDLRPTNRAVGFVFYAWMAMSAPHVLESFHIVSWKVFKSYKAACIFFLKPGVHTLCHWSKGTRWHTVMLSQCEILR